MASVAATRTGNAGSEAFSLEPRRIRRSWVKLIEILVQARPIALLRSFFHPDPRLRHGMRWYARMGRRVWLHEWWNFFFRDRRVTCGPSLSGFWGAPQDHQEVPLRVVLRRDMVRVTKIT